MAVNRGKKFEEVVKECFNKVPGVSIDRIHDQTTHYKGSTNICDFIVYKKPYEYYIECKSVHGNTIPIYSPEERKKYGAITNRQWEGMLEKSKIEGVTAGVIIWFTDHDTTVYYPIATLEDIRNSGKKSIRYDYFHPERIYLCGEKKRVFFDYDMNDLLKQLEWRMGVEIRN